MGDYQAKRAILGRHRQERRFAGARIEGRVFNIVMPEGKFWRTGRQVHLAPPDHSWMQVEANVTLGSHPLLHHLPCKAPATASEI
jgi:hypothetical protein